MTRSAILIVLAATAALFSGCPSGKSGEDGQTPQKDVELRLPLDTDVPTLDPAHIVDITGFSVGSKIFGRLVRFDENVVLKPEMAESYEVAADHKTITFHLKKGTLFQNGRECTAEDFVYSFTRLLDPVTRSERGSLLFIVEGAKEYFYTRQFPSTCEYILAGQFTEDNEPRNTLERLAESVENVVFTDKLDLAPLKAAIDTNIKNNTKTVDKAVAEILLGIKDKTGPPDAVTGLTAPDKYTFVVKLTEPYGPFIDQMAMISFAPVPKEVIQSMPDPDDFSRHPVGTGAFKLADWKADQFLLLEPYHQTYRENSHVSRIRYLVVPDRNTQFEMYKAGELDVCNVPTGQYQKFKKDAILSKELKRVDLLAVQFFVLNLTKDPWRDQIFQNKKALRQAVNYAIDRDYICDVVLEGRFRPFAGIIPPSMKEWTNPATALRPRYTYDVEKAQELLEESGHPQGLFLPTVDLTFNPQGDNPTIATEVAGDLRNISVKTNMVQMEWATFIDAMENNRLAFHRLGWVYDFPDPDNLIYTLLHSSQRGASGNFAWYRNPEVDKLIVQARTSFDRNTRRQLYWKIENIVLDDAPWLFCFAQTNNVLMKPWLSGVKLSGMDTDASLPNADLTKASISTHEPANALSPDEPTGGSPSGAGAQPTQPAKNPSGGG